MKNYKLSRNLWIFSGCCFFISLIASWENSKSQGFFWLNLVASILAFINAYLNQKKISSNNK